MNDRISDGLADLALWRTFLAVHRAGSVSAAARVLGIAQPTVTGHLQALERSVGETLFVRGARGVTATARADELAARLSAPFEQLAAALGGTGAAMPVEPVRIGAAAEFTASVVMPAVAPLVAAGLRVQATTGLADELLAALREGRLDLVVSSVRPRGRMLASAGLVDEEFVLVASPRLGIDPADVARQGPDALERHPLLAYAQDVPILRRYWRHVFGTRLERRPELVVPDLRALAAASVAGAGVTVLPTYLIADELAEGRLVPLIETDDPPINTLFLVRRPGAPTAVDLVESALRNAVE
ncbi:LysR family transcriptional regulator [Microbacterium sp. NPDC055903]